MTLEQPVYGDPFIVSVTEGRLDGGIEPEDMGLIRKCGQEDGLVSYVAAEVQEYGGAQRIYMCIPLGRVWTDDPGDEHDGTNAPNRVVKTEMAETLIERMAAAAVAMGVSDAKGARY